MKFIGQYIQDFIARFRSDVYLEDISTGTIASGGNLGLDSNNKIVKNTVGGGGSTDLTSDVTGILPVANGGTGQNSLGSVNISDLNNDSGFTTNTGDINRVQFSTSSGNAQVTSGNADFIFSTGSSPMSITNSGTTINVSIADASTSAKGAASFSSDNFAASSGAISIKSGGIDLTDEVTGALPVANGGTGSTSASDARTALGVDAAGTDNSTNVTLTGTPDYITISGQEITRNAIDLAQDVTGTLGASKGGTGLTSISTLLNSNTTKSDVGLGNVENTALSTYTGNGGALDNQYIINGAGYTTNVGDITGVTAGTNLSGGGSSGAVTINLADASESAKGAVELATTGEADTGTDTARAVTPAGLKSHVDTRFTYQYISFTGSATVPSDGDWMTVSANGISNHTWNTNLGSGGTTVGSSTVTIPTGAICQGIVVPYDCTLVGYASLIRSVGNHQSKVGLAVGVPTYNDFATFDCTLRAYNAADISAGPDSNYSQRPVRADSLSVNYSMSAGHVIFPLIGSVASNSRTVQWNCTLVLKTLLP